MTHHQANLQDQVKALQNKYQIPNVERLDSSFLKLEIMAQFYEDKIPEAPEAQKHQFSGFIAALGYAIALMRKYDQITSKLQELGEDKES